MYTNILLNDKSIMKSEFFQFLIISKDILIQFMTHSIFNNTYT